MGSLITRAKSLYRFVFKDLKVVGVFNKFVVLFATFCFLAYRAARILLKPMIKLHPLYIGKFLVSDIIVKNNYGTFVCRRFDEDFDLLDPGYESEEIEIVKKRLKSGDTFVDVGAHIGKYTVFASKIVGPKGRVISIEAHPRNFQILKRNVELNKLKNVSLVNCACLDKNEKILFYEGNQSGMHSAVRPTKKSINVQARMLDRILEDAKVRGIDGLKIDVEGAELNVLKGASHILKSSSPSIFVECVGSHEKVAEFLKKFGYKMKRISSSDDFIAAKV